MKVAEELGEENKMNRLAVCAENLIRFQGSK